MALEWLKSHKGDRILHFYAEYDEVTPDIVEFWSTALDAYVNEKKRLEFQYTVVEKAFIYEGVYPSSLKQTIPLLEKRGKLISVKDIQQEKRSEDSVLSLIITSFSSLFSPSKSPPVDISSEIYLFSSVLTEIVNAVTAAASARSDYDLVFSTSSTLSAVNTFHSFLTSSEVISETKSPTVKQLIHALTEQQASLVMDYLVSQNKGRYSDPHNNNIYASHHSEESTNKTDLNHSSDVSKLLCTPKSLFQLCPTTSTNTPIHNTYVSIYVLKHSLDSVDKHISKVQDKIQGYASQALTAHRTGGSKEAVLGVLHLKKLYTQNLQKLMGTKFHLEKSLIVSHTVC
ncbi:hypothetical protein EON65_30740 [archaeon]|nr:MAG: hypothetical protein EON65_30740 [archaeon]